MPIRFAGLTAAILLFGTHSAVWSQTQKAAAIVNGEALMETTVERAMRSVPVDHRAKARKEVLDFLIDNLLIEQHLRKLRVDAPIQEVEARRKLIEQELKAQGQEMKQLLEKLSLTEAELLAQIEADLRWENYVKSRTPDQMLAEEFRKSPESFDGSLVRARHILIATPPNSSPADKNAARQKLSNLKREIESKAAATNPATDDARLRSITEAFAEAAQNHSDCPSKASGGDVGSFPRQGVMVEPFAVAAFSSKPGQITEPVETAFGWHLILVTTRIPGRAMKFDEIKEEVRAIHAEKMREELLPQLRRSAAIEIK